MATEKLSTDIQASTICLRIGRNICGLRTAKGWTQRMLADHAGIEQAHLARLENGLKEPGVLILEKIAKALGVHIRDLF